MNQCNVKDGERRVKRDVKIRTKKEERGDTDPKCECSYSRHQWLSGLYRLSAFAYCAHVPLLPSTRR